MNRANLALRFLLELVGIAALAYWGYTAVESAPLQIALAVIGPAVLISVWGRVVAPRAQNQIGQALRVRIGSGILLVAALALGLAGQPTLALAFAALVVINDLLLLILGGPTEWK